MPITNAVIGKWTKVWHPELVNIYGCTIGNDCTIGCFVEIGSGVVIGDRCKIQSMAYIPSGVVIGDDVFIGPGAIFLNDKYPPSGGEHWSTIHVMDGASVGGGTVILPGVRLEKGCKIGAGAVVTKSVGEGELVVGVPACPRLRK